MTFGTVYVIGSNIDTGPVKIGFTCKPLAERLSALRIGSPIPLKVVTSIPASSETEPIFHSLCAEHRLHGEWFEREGKVNDLIRSMLSANAHYSFHTERKAVDAPMKRTRAPNGTFDRNAYQRELMRKRRAAEKAKTG